MLSFCPSEMIVSSSVSLRVESCTGRTNDWSILMMRGLSLAEVRERREAGAEVVQRDADAQRAEQVEHRHRLGDVDQRHALGDLQDRGTPAAGRPRATGS